MPDTCSRGTNYVPKHPWKPCLASTLSEMPLTPSHNELKMRTHPYFLQKSSCFRGPIYPQNLSLYERATFTDLRQEPLPKKNLKYKDSWFTLTLSPKNWDLPAFFGTKDIQPMITRSSPGSQ